LVCAGTGRVGTGATTATITTTPTPAPATPATPSRSDVTITLNARSAVLGIGETVRVTAFTDSTNNVRWSSNDTSIATVNSNGSVRAIAEGTTTIRATVDGVSAEIQITVRKAPTSVRANNISIRVNETERITVLLPAGTASRARTFRSLDTNIARVDRNGVVTGVRAGTTQIEVTTFNGKTARLTVTVR
jgi:uncharacterized protein YjdB